VISKGGRKYSQFRIERGECSLWHVRRGLNKNRWLKPEEVNNQYQPRKTRRQSRLGKGGRRKAFQVRVSTQGLKGYQSPSFLKVGKGLSGQGSQISRQIERKGQGMRQVFTQRTAEEGGGWEKEWPCLLQRPRKSWTKKKNYKEDGKNESAGVNSIWTVKRGGRSRRTFVQGWWLSWRRVRNRKKYSSTSPEGKEVARCACVTKFSEES